MVWLALGVMILWQAPTAFGQSQFLTVPIDGEPFAAALSRIDPNWNFTLQADSGARRLPAADLVRWGTAPELARGPMIVLADGGVLIAEIRQIEGEQVVADSILFGEVRLPLSRLRGVVLQPPAQRLERDRLLDRVAAATGSRDRLLLQNGDIVEGQLTAGGRPRQGPPAPREALRLETLKMQVENGVIDAPVDRVAAVIFNPSLVRAPQLRGLRGWLGFGDDGLIVAEKIESQNGLTSISLPGGIRLQTDDEGLRDSLQFVQPAGAKAVYLSDLTSIGYRHIPYLTLDWQYGRDRNVLGGRLRADGHTYLKGLGMHSTSRLAYRLDDPFRRLEAEIALDESAGREGSVIFRVYTSGDSGQWTPVYESSVVRGGDPPMPIAVDVSGAKGVALIVEHADRGDVLDHANWLDARLE